MKKIALWLLFLFCAPLALADAPRVTVAGSGIVNLAPDQFQINVSLSATKESISDSQQAVSLAVDAMTSALLEIGLGESDIVTTGYSCSPAYDYSREAQKLLGYQTSHSLQVKCTNLSLLDRILTIATESGLAEFYGISFDSSKRQEAYKQALSLALESAEEKAQALASSVGFTDISILEIEESAAYSYGNAMMAKAESRAVSDGAGIRSGDVSVEAMVNVVYEMK